MFIVFKIKAETTVSLVGYLVFFPLFESDCYERRTFRATLKLLRKSFERLVMELFFMTIYIIFTVL